MADKGRRLINVEDCRLWALSLRQQFLTYKEKGVYSISAHSQNVAPEDSFCLVHLRHKSAELRSARGHDHHEARVDHIAPSPEASFDHCMR